MFTYNVCPFGYTRGVFAQSAHIIIRISKNVTRPRQLSIKIIFRGKAWMVFALRTCSLGYAEQEMSYCITNMRRPMTVVNFDIITKRIQRVMPYSRITKRIAKVVDTATMFRIKQSLKVFSHMRIKRFDKENKEIVRVERKNMAVKPNKSEEHR